MGAHHICPHNPCKVAPVCILCCGLQTLPGIVGGEMTRMRSLQSYPLPPSHGYSTYPNAGSPPTPGFSGSFPINPQPRNLVPILSVSWPQGGWLWGWVKGLLPSATWTGKGLRVMGAPAKATCTVWGPSITGLYVHRNVLSPLSSRATSTVSRRPCGSTITTATSPVPAPAVHKKPSATPSLDTAARGSLTLGPPTLWLRPCPCPPSTSPHVVTRCPPDIPLGPILTRSIDVKVRGFVGHIAHRLQARATG